MKWILIMILLPFLCYTDNQNDLTWELVNEYKVQNVEAWDVDPMGKIIFSQNDVITKLDTTFNVQFTQSLKEIGGLTAIDARHALKTLIFSEDQQAIAFMDNTLTLHKGIKDLGKINVAYATHVSYSAQSSRYWVYDGDNSKLMLIDEMRQRPQVIENLAGTLGGLTVHQLMEVENRLLIYDKTKGVHLFDIYGSLIDFIPFSNGKSTYLTREHLYYITADELVRINLRSRNEIRKALPLEKIEKFRVLGNYVFFQTPTHLKKYLLKKV